ncbi:flagellar hook-associated protein FlgK [Roseinatronobacter alkalisoli]|uniref:Flagellar hook-associated protein 1 n=1 Tax=Roseinatronobacter alkalisoli TaxID=3028235 RepID=A0ABT5T500_9RHOB|nr:flagellar hook-associated protein FlgK [Roseinatronobacter sp. HJB301]MDD7970197.1 flagellar hook-associated protein FlgK [Roseinatronobacter sp. HJB301]
MSLSIAFHSAASGLQLASRGAQVVSDNIANANTDGFGVRSLTQSSRILGRDGSGVVMTGINRESDPALLAEIRGANAAQSNTAGLLDFWTGLEATIGIPGEAGALSTHITNFEGALKQASIQPESQSALQKVALSASGLADKINEIDASLQRTRDDADASISRDVNRLNSMFEQISTLNKDISRQKLAGDFPHALEDARQNLIDQASALIPLKEIARPDGRSMIMGADGTIFVDRDAARLEFQRTPSPAAGENVAAGELGRLVINGRAVPATNPLMQSGRIGSAFQLRDEIAPALQAQLDQFSEDLVVRFSDPGVDPTIPAGAFGLFAVAHETTMPPGLVGISGRIILNGNITPDDTGTTWRIRDGIYAAVPGAVSENATIVRMNDALLAFTPDAAGTGPDSDTLGHAAALLSQTATRRLIAESETAYTSGRSAALQELLGARGVDTDAELQKLLVLENSYAANARVMAAADSMLRTLLEM